MWDAQYHFCREEKISLRCSLYTAGVRDFHKVYLLSINEAEKYLKDPQYRICYGLDGQEACYWWLRSPGRDNQYAASVGQNGDIDYNGDLVNFNYVFVRPCIRLAPGSLPGQTLSGS